MIALHLPDDLAKEIGMAAKSWHVAAPTVGDLFDAVEREAPGLMRRTSEPGGRLRQHLNLFVGENLAGRMKPFAIPLCDGDEVWLLRAVSGG